MKVRTIVGIGLSAVYLILVTGTILYALGCGVVTYCLGLAMFYYGLPWTFLLISLFNLLGINRMEWLGYFLSGVAIIFNALILYGIPKAIAKFIYDAPEADTHKR